MSVFNIQTLGETRESSVVAKPSFVRFFFFFRFFVCERLLRVPNITPEESPAQLCPQTVFNRWENSGHHPWRHQLGGNRTQRVWQSKSSSCFCTGNVSTSLPPHSFAFRSLWMSPAPQTDTLSWRMTTTYSAKAGLGRDEDCHSSSSSCCCKFASPSLILSLLSFYLMISILPHPPCRAGIEAACPGGEIVYSTCTLSQQQNTSVVEQAVHWAQEELGIQLEVSQIPSLTSYQ